MKNNFQNHFRSLEKKILSGIVSQKLHIYYHDNKQLIQ